MLAQFYTYYNKKLGIGNFLDDTVTAGIIGFEVLNNIAKEEYVKIKNYTLTFHD